MVEDILISSLSTWKKQVELAKKVNNILAQNAYILATAESCTGGQLAQMITAIPGSSAVFDRGFVCYSNQAKHDMLSVPFEIINAYGAVSLETARAMAKGACKMSKAQLSLSITGIAGPDGGSVDKPVGTVCFALARRHNEKISIIEATRQQFDGNRQMVRDSAVIFALEMILYPNSLKMRNL